MAKLTTAEIGQRLLTALGPLVISSDPTDDVPLTFRAAAPLPPRIRAYLFNATNPPGGRSTPEYKSQLMVPNQGRNERGALDFSGDHAVIIAGYNDDLDTFIFWDADFHREFAFSANLQVREETVDQAVSTGSVVAQARTTHEVVLVAPPGGAAEAITLRFEGVELGDEAPPPPPAPSRSRGRRYRTSAPSSPEPGSRVFEVDPDLIDRGTQAHATTQNLLADRVRAAGLEPLEHGPADPWFDLAWIDGNGVAYVVEVKSRTTANEEKQLRLGLGQVLSYQYLLRWPEVTAIQPILAIESAPVRTYWPDLCAQNGVILIWPDTFDSLF